MEIKSYLRSLEEGDNITVTADFLNEIEEVVNKAESLEKQLPSNSRQLELTSKTRQLQAEKELAEEGNK